MFLNNKHWRFDLNSEVANLCEQHFFKYQNVHLINLEIKYASLFVSRKATYITYITTARFVKNNTLDVINISIR